MSEMDSLAELQRVHRPSRTVLWEQHYHSVGCYGDDGEYDRKTPIALDAVAHVSASGVLGIQITFLRYGIPDNGRYIRDVLVRAVGDSGLYTVRDIPVTYEKDGVKRSETFWRVERSGDVRDSLTFSIDDVADLIRKIWETYGGVQP